MKSHTEETIDLYLKVFNEQLNKLEQGTLLDIDKNDGIRIERHIKSKINLLEELKEEIFG